MNEAVAPVHNRMPALLHHDEHELWLDGSFEDDLSFQRRKFPPELMTMERTSDLWVIKTNDLWVIKKSATDARCYCDRSMSSMLAPPAGCFSRVRTAVTGRSACFSIYACQFIRSSGHPSNPSPPAAIAEGRAFGPGHGSRSRTREQKPVADGTAMHSRCIDIIKHLRTRAPSLCHAIAEDERKALQTLGIPAGSAGPKSLM